MTRPDLPHHIHTEKIRRGFEDALAGNPDAIRELRESLVLIAWHCDVDTLVRLGRCAEEIRQEKLRERELN